MDHVPFNVVGMTFHDLLAYLVFVAPGCALLAVQHFVGPLW